MAKLRPETHDLVRDAVTASADEVLRYYAHDRAQPAAVLDVGCGEGIWLDAARKQWPEVGIYGVDIDAPERASSVTRWDAEEFTSLPVFHDYSGGGEQQRRWPLVFCLEVAEHVTPPAGAHLVSELARVAERVLWSAAIPGQGGDGHVNEQAPAYWNHLFNAHGWFLSDPFRLALWNDERVAPWYRQNLLLAQPAVLHADGAQGGPVTTAAPPHLVHPRVFAHHRGLP